MRVLYLIACFGWAASGIANKDAPNSSNPPVKKPQIVFVLAGGFRSKINREADWMEKRLSAQIKRLIAEGRYDVLVVKTFFEGPTLERHTLLNDLNRYVFSNEESLSFEISRNGKFVKRDHLDSSLLKSSAGKRLLSFGLRDLLKGRQNHLVAIGHSHGGDLVMDLANQAADLVSLDLLATLDPIDREKCDPHWFKFDVARDYTVNRWLRKSRYSALTELGMPCTEAPSLGKYPFLEKLAKASGTIWDNYFQSGSLLHSGPMRGLGVKNFDLAKLDPTNRLFRREGTAPSSVYEGHGWAAESEPMWKKLESSLENRIGHILAKDFPSLAPKGLVSTVNAH